MGPVVGPTFYDKTSTPLSIFLKIFDEEVWEFMQAQEPDKHKTQWQDVTAEELKCYIGLVIAMGLVKKP